MSFLDERLNSIRAKHLEIDTCLKSKISVNWRDLFASLRDDLANEGFQKAMNARVQQDFDDETIPAESYDFFYALMKNCLIYLSKTSCEGYCLLFNF